MSKVVFNRTAHMTMWLAIADKARVTGGIPNNIVLAKEEALRGMGIREIPSTYCFACEYVCRNPIGCDACPLKDFDCDLYPFNYVDSLCVEYGGVADEELVKDFYEMCIVIAMWPVREGIVCQ